MFLTDMPAVMRPRISSYVDIHLRRHVRCVAASKEAINARKEGALMIYTRLIRIQPAARKRQTSPARVRLHWLSSARHVHLPECAQALFHCVLGPSLRVRRRKGTGRLSTVVCRRHSQSTHTIYRLYSRGIHD